MKQEVIALGSQLTMAVKLTGAPTKVDAWESQQFNFAGVNWWVKWCPNGTQKMPDSAAVYLYQQPNPPSRYVELVKFEALAGGKVVATRQTPSLRPAVFVGAGWGCTKFMPKADLEGHEFVELIVSIDIRGKSERVEAKNPAE